MSPSPTSVLARRASLILCVALLAPGCAALRQETLKKEGAGAYVYPKPIAEVWPHVLALLKEQGYPLKPAEGEYSLSTDYKEEHTSSYTLASRYLVMGQAIDETHCVVRFYKNTNARVIGTGSRQLAESQNTSGRDLDMEWALLRRADKTGAQQIEADAKLPAKARSTSSSLAAVDPNAPLSLEQALEVETQKKRLHPAVLVPATAGAVLVGTGTTFYLLARHQEKLLIDGDLSLTNDTDVRAAVQRGKTYETIGLTVLGVGVGSLVAACVLYYMDVVPRHPYAVSVAPVAGGGGIATFGGTF